MNQEVLKSVEKTNKDLEKYDSKVRQVTQQPEGQPKTTHNTQGPVDTSAHPASDTSSEGLTDIKIMAKKLEHITDLLTETRISPSPSSIPSTPSLSRDVSDITLMNSSQETSPSRYSSPRSIQRSVSKNAPQSTPSLARDVSNISGTTSSQETTPSRYSNLRSISRSVSKIAPQENILTKHPLLQFKDNQVGSSLQTPLSIWLISVVPLLDRPHLHTAHQQTSSRLSTRLRMSSSIPNA